MARQLSSLPRTLWKEVQLAPSATLIGIHIGPGSSADATAAVVGKCVARMKEIGRCGFTPESGIAIASIIALPVLHHASQLRPFAKGAFRLAGLGAQSVLYLPRNGFANVVLRSLAAAGLPDFLPLTWLRRPTPSRQRGATGDTPRLAGDAFLGNLRVASCVHYRFWRLRVRCTSTRPSRRWAGTGPPLQLQSSNVARANLVFESQTHLRSRKLCRAIEPLCKRALFCPELHRRLVMLAAASRDRPAWLRLIQNSWATRGRFNKAYAPCLVCGSIDGDRLIHLIFCKQLWRLSASHRRCV